jgi:hypothetical protein
MKKIIAVALSCIAVAACGNDRVPVDGTGAPPVGTGGAAMPGAASADWPDDETAGINLARQTEAQLTPGSAPDIIAVTAHGPRYDSLDIRLTIRNAAGDTLWVDEWNSADYFYFDDVAGRGRLEIARTVQAHVDTLLHDSRVTQRGLPEPMRRGDYGDLFRESTRYHLAELDWRNRASISPSEVTPRDAYDRIVLEDVAPARVGVVLSEVIVGPTYWYYAGGEASYIIGWSVREHAFVRIFSCC